MTELEGLLDELLRGAHVDPWTALSDAGYTGVGLPESLGGSGGTLVDAAVVLERAAYHAVPEPVAETAWLAGWLLAEAGEPLPTGRATAAAGPLTMRDGRVDGRLERVPFGGAVDHVIALGDGFLVRVDPADCIVERGHNLAGESRDTLVLPGIRTRAVATSTTADDLMLRGALARTVQLSGAARRALESSVRHAGEREQFGRPIGSFQAVQQQVAVLAAEAFVMDVAARAAVATPGSAIAVAAAKHNASRGARTVAAIAHQVHGAIGVTREHNLRLATTRLWSWAAEYGNAHHWAQCLGEWSEHRDPWTFVTSMQEHA